VRPHGGRTLSRFSSTALVTGLRASQLISHPLGGDAVRRNHLQNLTLIALAACYFTQIGAGVFALAIIARVVSAAPPRSLAILEGEYRYDSSAF